MTKQFDSKHINAKIDLCLPAKEEVTDMDEREVKCDNCQRHVPSENYQMHVVHCKRNIQLCSLCGEAVLRSEEREHFKEYHAEINCVQCGQKTTRSEEGNHLANECGKRPIPCEYCGINLPREKMPEHQEFCGSRTEWCHKCSRYILIRDLRNHEKSCDGGASQKCAATLPCEFCGSLIPLENLDVHQRQCLEESQDVQIPLLVEGDDGFFQEIAATKRRNSDVHDSTDAPSEAQAERNIIVALPCEICGELCPSDRLMKHQEECSQESENTVDPTASGTEENLYGSNLPHFRFSSAQRNSPNRGSLEDPFDDFTFQGSPYYILANVFRDLGERRWPFEMMRNVWSYN